MHDRTICGWLREQATDHPGTRAARRFREAADEIERLREALRYLLAFPGATEAQRRAREALDTVAKAGT